MRKIILLTLSICIIFTSVVGYASPLTQQMLDDLARYEILQGDPDGDLRLDDNVIITEAAKIVLALRGIRSWMPINYVYEKFYLVPPKHWANPWMYQSIVDGIIDYVPKDEFNEYSEVSNMYVVKMFMRWLGYSIKDEYKEDISSDSVYTYFTDEEIFETAKQIGLLEGLELKPEESATRYDMAVMAYNALDIPRRHLKPYAAANGRIEHSEVILNGENENILQTPRIMLDELAEHFEE